MVKIKNTENNSGLLIGGGILAAFVASLCCIGPLILTLIGVSGATALSRLDVLRVPMTILVLMIFAISGRSLYRKRNACEPGSICADSKKYKKMVLTYWAGIILALAALTSPYWIPWIFG